MNPLSRLLLLLTPLLVSSRAMAEGGPPGLFGHPALDPLLLLASVLYGVVGIALAMLGYKVFEKMVPFDLVKELEEDQNPAVGMVLGAVIIGTSIIVAASIH